MYISPDFMFLTQKILKMPWRKGDGWGEEKRKSGRGEGKREDSGEEKERIQISLKILFLSGLSPAARLIFV